MNQTVVDRLIVDGGIRPDSGVEEAVDTVKNGLRFGARHCVFPLRGGLRRVHSIEHIDSLLEEDRCIALPDMVQQAEGLARQVDSLRFETCPIVHAFVLAQAGGVPRMARRRFVTGCWKPRMR